MRQWFTSRRERRLWLLVLIITVTIYSTLGLAATLVGAVNEGLLVAAFALALVLTAIAIVTQGLRVRPGGMEIGIVIGVGLVYFLLSVRLALPERSHLMEYSVLAFLVYEALWERNNQGRHVPFLPLWAALATALAGAVDEGIQLFLPSRVFDWNDILFNTLAAVLTVTMITALRWVRRKHDTG